ncbi:hypothetical protein [Thermococcus sp. MAR1]|uniref:hypothetical protein n=1 Tax=Thermococcus sp. MAR1 TaxID=1638263 RepID=UPI0014388781|nr:hypothetical protein [Thermococcus sp. MAR1]NJE10061.1 hypothetical protein [Thermococcus sp. MAR1]
MGYRALIMRKLNGKWFIVYSHWGSRRIDVEIYRLAGGGGLETPFHRLVMLFDGLIEGIVYPRKLLSEVTGDQSWIKNEVEIVKNPLEEIDWGDLLIENWVIYDPQKFIFIYKPAITSAKIPLGTTLLMRPFIVKGDQHEMLEYFIELRSYVKALGEALGLGYLSEDEVRETLRQLTGEQFLSICEGDYKECGAFAISSLHVRPVIGKPSEKVIRAVEELL